MLSRLSYKKYTPKRVLDAGCGAAHALDLLRGQYPEMHYTGVDHSPTLLAIAQERHSSQPSLWQRLRRQPQLPLNYVQTDLSETLLLPESQNFNRSKLALLSHTEP